MKMMPKKPDSAQHFSLFASALENDPGHQYNSARAGLPEGYQNIIEPSLGSNNYVVEQSNMLGFPPSEVSSDEVNVNSGSSQRSQRKILPQKHGVKPVLPAFKSSNNETSISTAMINTSLSPNHSTQYR